MYVQDLTRSLAIIYCYAREYDASAVSRNSPMS